MDSTLVFHHLVCRIAHLRFLRGEFREPFRVLKRCLFNRLNQLATLRKPERDEGGLRRFRRGNRLVYRRENARAR